MEFPKLVRSLGCDPGHHEEIRNGPENKITYMEGFERTRNIPEGSEICPEGSGVFNN